MVSLVPELKRLASAHRTGRGEWYAVLTSFRREQGRERVIDVVDVKAKTQAEAIAAVAKLVAERANWLGPDMRLPGQPCRRWGGRRQRLEVGCHAMRSRSLQRCAATGQ